MKRLALALSMVLVCGISVAEGAKTALSQKAAQIKTGMSRQQVIALLGPATWAAIPGDTGDFGESFKINSRLQLVLMWKNGPCNPVLVDFGQGMKVTGKDEGRALCLDTDYTANYLPEAALSCSKPDRAKYCR